MELLFLIFILSAIFGGDSKSKKKKKNYRRRKSDYTDGWGWFHDHGQQI